MSAKLTDLRDDIDRIVSRLRRERADGEVPISAAIGTVRTELADSIAPLNDQLVDLTLRKLIHDVGGRKRPGAAPAPGVGLFGRYTGIPAMITIKRGVKRDTTKLTFGEADDWLHSRDRSDADPKDRDGKFRRLVEELRPFRRAETDTLEDAARRRHEAEGSNG